MQKETFWATYNHSKEMLIIIFTVLLQSHNVHMCKFQIKQLIAYYQHV